VKIFEKKKFFIDEVPAERMTWHIHEMNSHKYVVILYYVFLSIKKNLCKKNFFKKKNIFFVFLRNFLFNAWHMNEMDTQTRLVIL